MAACRAFTHDEVQQMMKTIHSSRDRLLIFLGILTGFRISELLSVKVSDLVDIDGTIKESLTVQRKHMKRKTKSRSVCLPDIHNWLNPWLKQMEIYGFCRNGDHLFIKATGQPIDRITAYRTIKAAARRIGLKGTIGTHSMRKTYAKHVHDANTRKDPATAMMNTRDALGHKSIASTEKYLESVLDIIDSSIKEHQAEMMHIFAKPAETETTPQTTIKERRDA